MHPHSLLWNNIHGMIPSVYVCVLWLDSFWTLPKAHFETCRWWILVNVSLIAQPWLTSALLDVNSQNRGPKVIKHHSPQKEHTTHNVASNGSHLKPGAPSSASLTSVIHRLHPDVGNLTRWYMLVSQGWRDRHRANKHLITLWHTAVQECCWMKEFEMTVLVTPQRQLLCMVNISLCLFNKLPRR